jgi:hypothetical protein
MYIGANSMYVGAKIYVYKDKIYVYRSKIYVYYIEAIYICRPFVTPPTPATICQPWQPRPYGALRSPAEPCGALRSPTEPYKALRTTRPHPRDYRRKTKLPKSFLR